MRAVLPSRAPRRLALCLAWSWLAVQPGCHSDGSPPRDAAPDPTDVAPIPATPSREAGAGYFFAKRTLDADPGNGAFARAFHATGRGHVVGISFYSQDCSMDGDEFTFLDGSRTPQIHGDGTEDDHNHGWGGAAYQNALWGGAAERLPGLVSPVRERRVHRLRSVAITGHRDGATDTTSIWMNWPSNAIGAGGTPSTT